MKLAMTRKIQTERSLRDPMDCNHTQAAEHPDPSWKTTWTLTFGFKAKDSRSCMQDWGLRSKMGVLYARFDVSDP